MEYRKLGRTGIQVSAVGMGCEGYEGKSLEESLRILNTAIQSGINFFDMYTSDPRARRHLGEALKGIPRECAVIQGHLCSAWKDGQYCRTRELGEVKASFESLLEDLGTQYVDVGMIHYSDELEDFRNILEGEIFEYILVLREQGKIRSTGLSTHNPDVALAAARSGKIDVILFSINPAYDMLPPSDNIDVLFERESYDRVYRGIDPNRERLYQECQNAGVALTVMKPFAGGLLLGDQSPFGKAMTPVQCISYCLDRPAVASVLGGMASPQEVLEAAAACTASAAQRDYSEVLSMAPRASFQGHCMYCGHCAPCTVGISIAAVNKYLDLAQAKGGVPETVQDHYDLLEHHAGECVACGACMKNCPFGTDIIAKMEQAARLFGK
ncbi:MAG: aldo/keto reductase [Oscillospiraceae bacterium]